MHFMFVCVCASVLLVLLGGSHFGGVENWAEWEVEGGERESECVQLKT